ncbi:hypothetical protein [Ochrobactrum sp. MC-1LL]|uniref:hypothetical protein n=1 Tax=Ochrobactrum sp. MC-1LL TaxID=2735351 RepID=UPI00143865F4|nr:hypothetical protein [Ochrobactrum sp. MC-1LL]NKE75030.1 hypothetical protein [Ochrobactrum sp. MC-1LL]
MSIERKNWSQLEASYHSSQDHMRWLHEFYTRQLTFTRMSQLHTTSFLYRNEPDAKKERNLGVLMNIEAGLEKIIKQLEKVI